MNAVADGVEFPLSLMQVEFAQRHAGHILERVSQRIAEDFPPVAVVQNAQIHVLQHSEVQFLRQRFVNRQHKNDFADSRVNSRSINSNRLPVVRAARLKADTAVA